MLKLLLLIALSFSSIFANEINKSVVKVFSTKAKADYKYPWQTSKIQSSTGTGAIIKGNLILTAAHVVAGSRLLEVKKENNPKKYLAKIKYISHQADLAILEIEDKEFFKNTKHLKLSRNVTIRDEVSVVGYPIGGKNISTTTGIISRIEEVFYVYSANKLLAIQVDAAINPGNSGGPAVNSKNELIGIAMMKIKKASNIAYLVPTDIINTFIEDSKDGVINGFAIGNATFHTVENETLKSYYNLKDGNGVVISNVGKYEKDLEKDDIILEIDGIKIANNGTIKTKYGRISYTHIYKTKQLGEKISLKIVRDNKIININKEVKKVEGLIKYEHSKMPKYIIYGGLVFAPITKNYLYSISKVEANYYKQKLFAKVKNNDYKEAITMLGTSFPHKINRGYKNWASVLNTVNKIKIKSFNHLLKVLDENKKEYTKFGFLNNSTIVLNTKEAKDSFLKIKNIYRLSSDRSD